MCLYSNYGNTKNIREEIFVTISNLYLVVISTLIIKTRCPIFSWNWWIEKKDFLSSIQTSLVDPFLFLLFVCHKNKAILSKLMRKVFEILFVINKTANLGVFQDQQIKYLKPVREIKYLSRKYPAKHINEIYWRTSLFNESFVSC